MLNYNSLYGRFFQLGYVTRDIDAAVAQLEKRMGARQIDLIHDIRNEEGKPVTLLHLSHMSLPGVELEIIQPRLDWPSLYLEALPAQKEDVGFHHMGFMLPDEAAWNSVTAQLDIMETPIVVAMENSQVRVAYIDTRRQTGHYSELVLRFHPESARPLPI